MCCAFISEWFSEFLLPFTQSEHITMTSLISTACPSSKHATHWMVLIFCIILNKPLDTVEKILDHQV